MDNQYRLVTQQQGRNFCIFMQMLVDGQWVKIPTIMFDRDGKETDRFTPKPIPPLWKFWK